MIKQRNRNYACYGSLEWIQSNSIEEEEGEEEATERQRRQEESSDEDQAVPRYAWTRSAAVKKVNKKETAEMSEKFHHNVRLDSESSGSLLFDSTDNSDEDEAEGGRLEPELDQNFPENKRVSMFVGINDDKRSVNRKSFPSIVTTSPSLAVYQCRLQLGVF